MSCCRSVSSLSADEVAHAAPLESRDDIEPDPGMVPVSLPCWFSLLPVSSADRRSSVAAWSQWPAASRRITDAPRSAAPGPSTSSSSTSNFRYFRQSAPLLSGSSPSWADLIGHPFLFAKNVAADTLNYRLTGSQTDKLNAFNISFKIKLQLLQQQRRQQRLLLPLAYYYYYYYYYYY